MSSCYDFVDKEVTLNSWLNLANNHLSRNQALKIILDFKGA